MPAEIIDATCPSCHRKNLLLKRLTEGIYRCDHCQSQLSNQFISSTSQTQIAMQGGKIVSLSILVSVGLLVSFVRGALGVSQSPTISSALVTSQSKAVADLPIIMAQSRSLPSETTFISQFTGSGGALTVVNGTKQDAFVKLVEPLSRTLIAAFFVKSGTTLTQEQIPDGTYRVLFVLGKGWNSQTQSFNKGKSFARFDKSLNFTTTQLGNGIQYKVFKITLHPVVGGNARTSGINEQEFSRY
jgi:hypothetical protein